MPFSLTEFVQRWPYAYHLTSASNLRLIIEARCLLSAAELIAKAGAAELMSTRRRTHTPIRVDGAEVWLRDQSPLHSANVAFEGGWNFTDLLSELNRLVFFWPGTIDGPNRYGVNHFNRYRHEEAVIIRVSTAQLIAANQGAEPMFSAYNSGAPRYSGGKASPRGPSTFVGADRFSSPSRVVELAFRTSVRLPDSSEVRPLPSSSSTPAQAPTPG
jgi:hypothetical protein